MKNILWKPKIWICKQCHSKVGNYYNRCPICYLQRDLEEGEKMDKRMYVGTKKYYSSKAF
jgi:hypothetical protein